MNSRRLGPIASLVLTLALLLCACDSAGSSSNGQQNLSTSPAKKLTKVTLDLGYTPSIQFASFYLAKVKGYYRQAGLDVTFKHGVETNLLSLIGTNKLQYGVASGDEMLTARAKGVPVVYVGAWYQKYPVVLITRKDSGITTIQQLRGKTIGVPGPYGATYNGLNALLYSAHMTASDVKVKSIGYNQVQALQRKQVDAVMGYANNEPLQLKRLGVAVNTIPVWQHSNLVSNGIVTNETTLKNHSDQVKALVQATMRGVEESVKHPDEAFNASLQYVPEAKQDRDAQMSVLKATIPLWQSALTRKHGLGYTDPAAWESTAAFLRRASLLKGDTQVASAYTNKFVSINYSALSPEWRFHAA